MPIPRISGSGLALEGISGALGEMFKSLMATQQAIPDIQEKAQKAAAAQAQSAITMAKLPTELALGRQQLALGEERLLAGPLTRRKTELDIATAERGLEQDKRIRESLLVLSEDPAIPPKMQATIKAAAESPETAREALKGYQKFLIELPPWFKSLPAGWRAEMLATPGFNPHEATNKEIQAAKKAARAWELEKIQAQAGIRGLASSAAGQLKVLETADFRLTQVDGLIKDMRDMTERSKALGIGTPSGIPFLTRGQFEAIRLGGETAAKLIGFKDPKGVVKWLAEWDKMDARFATIAQAVEYITGNRLAQVNTTRALGFHPRSWEPYDAKLSRIEGLEGVVRDVRSQMRAYETNLVRQLKEGVAAGISPGPSPGTMISPDDVELPE